ncbi:hypothetical protein D9758_015621 [Tetrapyrgos nigripes]|uniref:HMG box domain-containing protein n=1 Tax=Tetrapyrgos nigripes TaxID=182062 RepID=A0A8H5CKE6_9AGAR|nr:hypothetical protein D9758_015621 [Tetrapyrgos nigripes]
MPAQRKKSSAGTDGKTIKRPPNSWILFRADRLTEIKDQGLLKDRELQGDLSKRIAEQWKKTPQEVKDEYQRRADEAKAEHRRLYPDYKYQPKKKGEERKKIEKSLPEDDGEEEKSACSYDDDEEVTPWETWDTTYANDHGFTEFQVSMRKPSSNNSYPSGETRESRSRLTAHLSAARPNQFADMERVQGARPRSASLESSTTDPSTPKHRPSTSRIVVGTNDFDSERRSAFSRYRPRSASVESEPIANDSVDMNMIIYSPQYFMNDDMHSEPRAPPPPPSPSPSIHSDIASPPGSRFETAAVKKDVAFKHRIPDLASYADAVQRRLSLQGAGYFEGTTPPALVVSEKDGTHAPEFSAPKEDQSKPLLANDFFRSSEQAPSNSVGVCSSLTSDNSDLFFGSLGAITRPQDEYLSRQFKENRPPQDSILDEQGRSQTLALKHGNINTGVPNVNAFTSRPHGETDLLTEEEVEELETDECVDQRRITLERKIWCAGCLEKIPLKDSSVGKYRLEPWVKHKDSCQMLKTLRGDPIAKRMLEAMNVDDEEEMTRESALALATYAIDVKFVTCGASGDGDSMPDKRCSSCISMDVESISQSCKDLIREILKGTESESYLSDCFTDDASITTIVVKLSTRIKELESQNALLRRKPIHTRPGEHANVVDDHTNLPSEPVEQLTQDIAEFTLPSTKKSIHFGESSNMTLVLTAMGHRKQVDTTMPQWQQLLSATKRPQFWNIPSWIPHPKPECLRYEFPDDDELKKLTDAYFNCHNLYSPLLHRPSFERSMADNLHLRDEAFGAVVLAVCATGSRYRYTQTDSESTDQDLMLVISGMKWFQQLPLQQFAFVQNASLWHLQMYCIAMVYLQNLGSGPDVGWMLTGVAIRIAQELGIHRRSVIKEKPTAEGELLKRVFWILVLFDFKMSVVFGRPRAMSTEDFDLGLPIECDDEYWENCDHPFVQPLGKPSLMSFWNSFMNLCEISICAAQLLYPMRNSELEGSDRLQKAVLEIDSSLNKWIDSVPSHLRWDLEHQDMTFFKQSALLYATYYWTQIEVHRRFIPRPGQDSKLSFPSMAICTNAARSCIHIIEMLVRQTRDITGHFIPVFVPLYTSAMVLAINLWRGKQVNPTFNPRPDLVDIYKCIDISRKFETSDIIHAVISATQVFFGPEFQHFPTQKSPMASTHDLTQPQVFSVDLRDLNVPLYSSDLGQNSLPVYDPFIPDDVAGYLAPDLGYNHAITTEELAIFDDEPDSLHARRSLGFCNDDFAQAWPRDLTQPQDWDVFMSNMDQLLSNV